MKTILRGAIAATAMLALAGCELLLGQKNLFAGFEADQTEKYADLSPDETIEALDRDSNSPTFYEDLEENPETAQIILDTLEVIYTDPVASPAEVEEAALYASAIILNTTDAGDVVNSLAEGLLELGSSDEPTEADIISAFLNPVNDLIDDATDFDDFINQMIALTDIYDELADAVGESGTTNLSGDVAQAAAVAYILAGVVDAIDAPDQDAQIEALRLALIEITDDDPMTDGALTFTAGADPFADVVATDSSLLAILEAAGMGDIADLLGDLNA
jgi:hypothetical protein